MLRIGEFAAITGISIHMLRHYDKIGLLIPEKTDPDSSYRYYGEKQIVIANQIQLLKNLGFGLKEIESVQLNGTSNEQMKHFLEVKIKEKEEEQRLIQGQIQQMKESIQELDAKEQYAMTVTVKKLPARKVASTRGILHAFQEEGRLWMQLTKECQRMKVMFADVDYSFAITHHLDLKKMEIDVEVLRVVESMKNDTDTVHFKELPQCEAATVAFCGEYQQIGEINRYVFAWMKKNGYILSGLPFSTYYISPGNEKNPKNFITELCFPISKMKSE